MKQPLIPLASESTRLLCISFCLRNLRVKGCKKGGGFIAKSSWRQGKDPGMVGGLKKERDMKIFGTKL